MSEPKLVRPPQVTVAGWLVVAGSVVVVLMAFDQVSALRSLETREAVEEYLSKPPGDRSASVCRARSAAAGDGDGRAAVPRRPPILGWQVLRGRRAPGSRCPCWRCRSSSRAARGWPVPALPAIVRRDRDAVVPARPGLVRRGQARSAGAASRRVRRSRRATRSRATRCSTCRRPPRRRCTPRRTPPRRRPGPRPPRATRGGGAGVRADLAVHGGGLRAAGPDPGRDAGAPDTLMDELHKQNPDLADQGVTDAVLRDTVYVSPRWSWRGRRRRSRSRSSPGAGSAGPPPG